MGCAKTNTVCTSYKPVAYESIKELIAQGKIIIIFEDNVLDLTSFAAQHPGGKECVTQLLGKEVSRYIYGGFIMPSKTTVISHSSEAIATLLKYTVGKTIPGIPEMFLLPAPLKSTIWNVIKKDSITKVHYRFKFVSPNAKVKAILPGVSHAGKYFTITHLATGKKRNFGLFFTATEMLLPKYLALIDAVKKGEDWVPPFEDINSLYRDGMEFFMKKKNDFSKIVCELPMPGEPNYSEKDCQFKFDGPFGTGLKMNECPHGLVVAVICGTSVAMWLEVVAYMIRRAAYELGKTKGKDYRLFKNEAFEHMNSKDFKLIIFSSFSSKDIALGKDVFEVMETLSKAMNLDIFEYHLRTSDETKEYYTESYFKDKITKVPERIYFWGPYGAKESLTKIFLNLGYSNTSFYDV